MCIHISDRITHHKLRNLLTPGTVRAVTENGPTLKSHFIRNKLKAGPEDEKKRKKRKKELPRLN